MSEYTKISLQSSAAKSLKTTIPKSIVDKFSMKVGDELMWSLENDNPYRLSNIRIDIIHMDSAIQIKKNIEHLYHQIILWQQGKISFSRAENREIINMISALLGSPEWQGIGESDKKTIIAALNILKAYNHE